ncbi:MAG: putative sugar nucleotidyl transferase [Chitinophagaceae bacterium]
MIVLGKDSSDSKASLYPLTQLRSAWAIRSGILTLREKWEYFFQTRFLPQEDGTAHTSSDHSLTLPSNSFPTSTTQRKDVLAGQYESCRVVHYPWQLFQWNDSSLREDFLLITKGRTSAPIPSGVQALAPGQIFIEPGAVLSPCLLNAQTGPIYIGKDAEIMEGALIRGPFALGEKSCVRMGARIYGATTIGPHCVVGGEIKNSIFFGYSNKVHDGYLGDSVIGEWCNLGAGTTVSNLKNNASTIYCWNPVSKKSVEVGQKCGLIMGDHSRSAIQTSFNSGTLTGIAANIFGSGLTPSFIPDFSWGQEGAKRYEWEKLVRDLRAWKQLKGQELTPPEIALMRSCYEQALST